MSVVIMLPIVEISQIKTRAEAVNLSLKRLAQRAGVDPTTAYKGARGICDPRSGTVNRLLEQLELEERRLRLHLDRLSRTQAGRQLDLLEKGAA